LTECGTFFGDTLVYFVELSSSSMSIQGQLECALT